MEKLKKGKNKKKGTTPHFPEKKFSAFLEALGSQAPVPGGGSAAACVGALGAALLEKVTRFTLSRKSRRLGKKEIKRLLGETLRLRRRFLRLVDEDVRSYLAVSQARRAEKLLTKGRPGEKLVKRALRKALSSSLSLCTVCHRGILLSRRLLQIGNPNLRSDTEAALFLFLAAFDAGRVISEANVTWLKDRRTAQQTRKIFSPLRRDIRKITDDAQKR